MEPNEIITLINQDGEKVELELIDTIKTDGNEYVIAAPKESDDAHAYKLVIKNGETEFLSIGNGDEFNRVLQKYNEN